MTKAEQLLSLLETDVAKIILQQLGGNKFIAMTGAKNLTAGENYLSFKIGKNSSQANFVKIELTPADTYTVTFIKTFGSSFKELKKFEDVYADSLQEIFTHFTGMDTHL